MQGCCIQLPKQLPITGFRGSLDDMLLQMTHTPRSVPQPQEAKIRHARDRFRRLLRPAALRFGTLVATVLGIQGLVFAAGNGESGAVARVGSEVSAEFMKGFRALDQDQDGQIELAPMVRILKSIGYGQPQPRRRGGAGARGGNVSAMDPFDVFESRDEDGDGVLQGEEIPGFMRRSQAAQASEIDLDEFRQAFAAFQSRAREGGGRRGGRGGAAASGQSATGSAGSRAPDLASSDVQFLSTLDANRDMNLSADEAKEAIHSEVAAAMQAHAGLDTNGDGQVSAREYGLSQPIRGDNVDQDGLDGHARGHFSREDTDGNGLISNAEASERVLQRLLPRFRAMQLGLRMASADSNLDHKLDAVELQALSPGETWTPLEVSSDQPLDIASLYGKLYMAPLEVTEQIDKALSRK